MRIKRNRLRAPKNQYNPNKTPLSCHLQENISNVKNAFGKSSDLNLRTVNGTKKAAIFFISGITNTDLINEHIIERINESSLLDIEELKNIISVNNISESGNQSEIVNELVKGNTVILLDGFPTAIVADTKQIETRSIEESSTQAVIRGPKESFSESYEKNTALLRGRIQSPQLRIESMEVGEVTQTKIGVAYVENIVNKGVLQEVMERISSIKVDAILDSSYIDTFIKDNDRTVFPLIQDTERPDTVAAALLEGKVAIFVDGTPFVLIAPAVFNQFFQSAEDYYQNQYISSFLRIIRFGSFFVSLLAPAIYIALVAHHEGLVPTTLLVSILAQREGVPFPIVIEALMMEIIFEVLREAGIRMPRTVGSALSIVGALIIGQAAVEAGFVAASTVIVVSLTAISSFSIPYYSMSTVSRLLRFIFLIFSSFIGIYGILIAFIIILLHMCSLRSFGMPYLTPFAPIRKDDLQDSVVRKSLRSFVKRPYLANSRNRVRMQQVEGEKSD
ncbi:MAG: spore germination protein [Bacillota bacterium]